MMKFLPFFAFLGLALSSDVLEFTTSNFNAEVGATDIILVEFYAPWCGHCKKLAPEYEKAATKLKSNDPPIALAKVDCVADESKDVCSRFGVSGYPTLKIFRGGDTANPEDYNGPREANGIVNFMKARSGPASKELSSVTDFETFKTKTDDTMIIGFFKDSSSALGKEFLKAANALRENFEFAHTYDAEVAKAAGDFTEDVIVLRPVHLHSKLEENHVALGDATAKSSAIQSFIKSKFSGLAGHMTNDNEQFFKKPLCVAYYQVDYERNVKGTNYWRNRVAKVAQKFDGKMNFAVASKEDFGGVLSDMNINTKSEDVNVVCWTAEGLKFRMDPDTKFSMDTLEAFVQQYLDEKLEPYLKSEEVPADNSGPVKVVVAKNFNEIVNDPERDVLIEFYAPWCGHCKSLEPKYVELGEKLAGQDSVVIAKMDATANDVPPPYNVRGFPTIFWAPKGSKGNPKKYEGGREVNDFVAFIKKEASNKSVKDEL
jgi:protein disulfide isomerase family A protein 3